MTRALLIVDVQNDFCEGGALAVQGGNDVAQRTADLLLYRPGLYTSIFASQDWHNPLPDLNGGHFAPEGTDPDYVTSWPVHCVAGTRGSELHPALDQALEKLDQDELLTMIRKGQGRPDYSAFQGVTAGNWPLENQMRFEEVTSLDVVGLATDYCVQASTLHALQLLIPAKLEEVRVITDLTAGVNQDSTRAALLAMQEQGAKLTTRSRL